MWDVGVGGSVVDPRKSSGRCHEPSDCNLVPTSPPHCCNFAPLFKYPSASLLHFEKRAQFHWSCTCGSLQMSPGDLSTFPHRPWSLPQNAFNPETHLSHTYCCTSLECSSSHCPSQIPQNLRRISLGGMLLPASTSCLYVPTISRCDVYEATLITSCCVSLFLGRCKQINLYSFQLGYFQSPAWGTSIFWGVGYL